MRRAYADGGVAPSTIGFVECHATGTQVGDASEVRALAAVYGAQPHAVALGSAKPFVGHLRGGAGAVGMLRAVLALKHGQIPAQIEFETPNPALELEATPFYVPTRTTRARAGRRRAGGARGGQRLRLRRQQLPRRARGVRRRGRGAAGARRDRSRARARPSPSSAWAAASPTAPTSPRSGARSSTAATPRARSRPSAGRSIATTIADPAPPRHQLHAPRLLRREPARRRGALAHPAGGAADRRPRAAPRAARRRGGARRRALRRRPLGPAARRRDAGVPALSGQEVPRRHPRQLPRVRARARARARRRRRRRADGAAHRRRGRAPLQGGAAADQRRHR